MPPPGSAGGAITLMHAGMPLSRLHVPQRHVCLKSMRESARQITPLRLSIVNSQPARGPMFQTARIRPRRVLVQSVLASAAMAAAALLALPAPGSAQELDMNAIMPCGTPDLKGKQDAAACDSSRAIFVQQCTSCHTIVPIVRQQKNDADWDATMTRHRERVPDLSPAEFDSIAQFLKDHFKPERPVPNLPQQLIDNDPGFPPA